MCNAYGRSVFISITVVTPSSTIVAIQLLYNFVQIQKVQNSLEVNFRCGVKEEEGSLNPDDSQNEMAA